MPRHVSSLPPAEQGEQHGFLLISTPAEDGTINAAWSDTFHHSPALGILAGRVDDRRVHLDTEYSGWGWTIDVEERDGALLMQMHNVIPEGVDGAEPGPYVVMDARWEHVARCPSRPLRERAPRSGPRAPESFSGWG